MDGGFVLGLNRFSVARKIRNIGGDGKSEITVSIGDGDVVALK
jgi:hypothetical protein